MAEARKIHTPSSVIESSAQIKEHMISLLTAQIRILDEIEFRKKQTVIHIISLIIKFLDNWVQLCAIVACHGQTNLTLKQIIELQQSHLLFKQALDSHQQNTALTENASIQRFYTDLNEQIMLVKQHNDLREKFYREAVDHFNRLSEFIDQITLITNMVDILVGELPQEERWIVDNQLVTTDTALNILTTLCTLSSALKSTIPNCDLENGQTFRQWFRIIKFECEEATKNTIQLCEDTINAYNAANIGRPSSNRPLTSTTTNTSNSGNTTTPHITTQAKLPEPPLQTSSSSTDQPKPTLRDFAVLLDEIMLVITQTQEMLLPKTQLNSRNFKSFFPDFDTGIEAKARATVPRQRLQTPSAPPLSRSPSPTLPEATPPPAAPATSTSATVRTSLATHARRSSSVSSPPAPTSSSSSTSSTSHTVTLPSAPPPDANDDVAARANHPTFQQIAPLIVNNAGVLASLQTQHDSLKNSRPRHQALLKLVSDLIKFHQIIEALNPIHIYQQRCTQTQNQKTILLANLTALEVFNNDDLNDRLDTKFAEYCYKLALIESDLRMLEELRVLQAQAYRNALPHLKSFSQLRDLLDHIDKQFMQLRSQESQTPDPDKHANPLGTHRPTFAVLFDIHMLNMSLFPGFEFQKNETLPQWSKSKEAAIDGAMAECRTRVKQQRDQKSLITAQRERYTPKPTNGAPPSYYESALTTFGTSVPRSAPLPKTKPSKFKDTISDDEYMELYGRRPRFGFKWPFKSGSSSSNGGYYL